MHPLFDDLLRTGPVVTDGAWGTQLQLVGLPPGECPDGWNISHPEEVARVASSYVAAGSRVILTNTFRANRIALAGHGLAEEVGLINRRGVELSRAAAGSSALVFASIGPSGRMLMSGDTTEEELSAVFAEQAVALAGAAPDAIVVETMTDLTEAVLALHAARKTGLPVVVSMVFDSGRNHDRTMMGATPEQVAVELTAAGADAVGANCGLGMDGYIPVCARLHESTDRPIWIKPNAGLPRMVDGAVTYTTTADEFARRAPELRDAGASFIGGCCGTTPAFVAALLTSLHSAASRV
jgi:methionine synthase I (cobalamin-dependent)